MNFITGSTTLKLQKIKKSQKIIPSFFMVLGLFLTHVILFAPPAPTPKGSLSRVYNERFIGQIAQSPALGTLGTLDATFSDVAGSIGSIDLIAQTENGSGGQACAVLALPDSSFLVALSTQNVGSRLVKYNAQGTLDESYGTNGIVAFSTDTQSTAKSMILDAQARVLIGGGYDTTEIATGWIRRVAADGSDFTVFGQDSLVSWNFVGGIALQSDGKIIAVGKAYTPDDVYNSAIARYNLDGSVDTSFGTQGYIFLNGDSLPESTSGLYSVVVDAQDNIYVVYLDDDGARIARFNSDGSLLGVNAPIAYLAGATPSSLRMAIDGQGNLIVAGVVPTTETIESQQVTVQELKVTGISSEGEEIQGFTNFNSYVAIDLSSSTSYTNFDLQSLVTTNDGSILLGGGVSPYTGDPQVAVITLIGAGDQYGGELDTTFNPTPGTPGYIFYTFNADVAATINLFNCCLSPDGRIYTVGYKSSASAPLVPYPYVSRLYNTQYDSQVAQFPATDEQGINDLTFGQTNIQTYQGVVSPYCGNYRGSLQQESMYVIEVGYSMQESSTGVGNLLVGGNGYTNDSSVKNMMLNWLTPAGILDNNFGTNWSGQLVLENETGFDEYLNAIAQGSSGALYVAGSSGGSATLRKYTSGSTTPEDGNPWTVGTAYWNSSYTPDSSETSAKGYGVVLQGTGLVLLLQGLYNDDDTTGGMIAAYDATTGVLADGNNGAPTFGDGGSGFINQTSFDLNMGRIYNAVVNAAGDIFIAYGATDETERGDVTVVGLKADGSGLITEFGDAGIVSNLFGSSNLKSWNVNIGAGDNGKLLIACCDDGNLYVARLDGVTGKLDMTFNNTGMMYISVSNTNLYAIQGLSDGSIMVIGYIEVDNAQMFMTRITQDGQLDRTFNSQGLQPGVYLNQVGQLPSYGYSTTIQSTDNNVGNIIMVGSQQEEDIQSSPTITRIFGQPGTSLIPNFSPTDQYPGTLDLSLNGTGAMNFSELLGSGTLRSVFAYPDGNEFEGMLLLGIEVQGEGLITRIARVYQSTMELDHNFGMALEGQIYPRTGYYDVSPYVIGLNSLSVDVNNNILIGGTDSQMSNLGWAQQLSPDGSSAIGFNVSSLSWPKNFIKINAVFQQKSGRYIVAGENANQELFLAAFQDQLVGDNGMLALDPTFNPLGTIPGTFVVLSAVGALYNLAINDDDTMVVAYGYDSVIKITKVLANGSALDQSFGNSGLVTTTISYNGANTIRLAIDSQQNIVVAAATVFESSSNAVVVARYDADGGTTNAFTGAGVVSGVQNVVIAASSSVTFTSLLETEDQQTILLGYSLDPTPLLYAARLDSDGVLDTTWNPQATLPDVPGILSYAVAGASIMGNGCIGVSGNVWVAATSVSTNNAPILIEIVGDSYVQQVAQDPLAAPAGTLDYTLDPTGALSLTTPLELPQGTTPQKLAILSDQSMIMASYYDGDIIITKINPLLQLDTAFAGGCVTINSPEGADYTIIHDMIVADPQDSDSAIYITGTYYYISAESMFAYVISADGSTVTSLTASNSLTNGYVIRQTPAGNVLIAGYAGGTITGIIAEFTPDLSELTTFGNGGYYTTAVPSPIAAMTVDDQGRIYIAYAVNTTTPYNGGILYIQRISADGITLDGSFGMGGTVSMLAPEAEFDPYQIKLQLDNDNGFLVVAGRETRGEFARVSCFSTDGDSWGDVDVNIQPNAQENDLVPFNISDLFIDTAYRIYLVGYTTSNDTVELDSYHTVVARIIVGEGLSIDTENYAVDSATPGIANFQAGPLYRSFTRVNGNSFMIGGAILDQDRRVYVVGQSGGDATSNAYMIRLFGDYYAEEVSQAVPLASEDGPGYFDDTYGSNGVATTYADGQSTPDAGQQARAILPFNTGTNSVTVIGDGTSAWTVRLLPDGSNDPSYGSGQGIMIAQNATGSELVHGMVFEGSGNEIVFGSNDIIGGYIKNILPSGEMNPVFGGYTGKSTTTNYPAGTMYIPDFDIVNSVAQLSNGFYIFAGNKNNIGMIGMMSPTGIVIPFSNNVSGYFTLGANIASVSIDAQENIFASVAMADTSVSVIKLNTAGAYVSGYGNAGVVSDVLTGINDPANIRSALDGDGNLLVAGTIDQEYGIINVLRLLPDGSVDPNFNSGSALTITFDPGTSGVITNLIPLQSGQTLVGGYQYYSDHQDDSDYEFVACITSDGILDVTFGAYEPTPGLVKFQIASGPQTGRNIWGMSVQWNGQILLAGSEGPIDGGEIPLTMRINGYENIKAIPQFPTLGQVDSNNLDLLFNASGIAYSDAISNLIDGGYTVIDSQKRIILGGMTSDNIFIAARFLPNGKPDLSFGNQGVASAVIPNVSGGSFIAITGSDEHILVGGVTSDHQFVIVQFAGDNGAKVTTFGTAGLASSPIITNLVGGGYISIDYEGNILVGGRTSDNTLVVARFTSGGIIDATFNSTGAEPGVATTDAISGLHNGGFVTAKGVNGSMYLGGVTTDTLVIAKILFSGTLDSDFGDNGVASVNIPELVDGGSVAVDGSDHIIIGGYTSNKVFVVAKFAIDGTLDPLFNNGGIAYSNSLSSLTSVGDIFVTSNNFILIGGTSVGYDNVSTSMVVASFSDTGAIETTLSPTGLGSTGIIPGLVAGGFVAANVYDNPFVGGFTDESELVVAKLLSGYEIFITNPNGLSPQQFKIFWYGNNPALFRDFFAIEFYARVITDQDARIATIAGIKLLFDEYVEIYGGQPGWNLVNSTYRYNNQFAELEIALALEFSDSINQIHEFFTNFNGRRVALQIL